jgi:hypothetical protein
MASHTIGLYDCVGLFIELAYLCDFPINNWELISSITDLAYPAFLGLYFSKNSN